MNLPRIEIDPRFARGVELFNARDYFEASELFEELFFDAAGDELEFARVFLQVSVGLVHAERRQQRAAISRLEEAVRAIERVSNRRGIDLAAMRGAITSTIDALARGEVFEWPVVRRNT